MNTIKGECHRTDRLVVLIKYIQIPACFMMFSATVKSYGKIQFCLKALPVITNPRITL